jgi:myo-inositol-1(or 4)-monophosphatase
MTPNDLQTRLLVATAIAHEAGTLARRRFLDRSSVVVSFKGHQDYLTETDGEVERLVAGRLAAAFPEDGLIGEEGGSRHGEGTWIIDPIDGTANFARGVPHFCISIGFIHKGMPEVGVIYAPMQDEMYAARRGAGATLNGMPLAVSTITNMREATVEIGWSPRRPAQEYMRLLERTYELGASVRRAGSGSLGLAYTAAGRIDAFGEPHINSWDVLAGIVLVKEAGGRVSDFFAGEGMRKGNPILVVAPGIADPVSTAFDIALMD